MLRLTFRYVSAISRFAIAASRTIYQILSLIQYFTYCIMSNIKDKYELKTKRKSSVTRSCLDLERVDDSNPIFVSRGYFGL